MNNPSAILPVASFPPSPAVLQVGIYLFVRLICRLISMLTLPDPYIQRFYAHRALAGFMLLNAYNLWAPFFYRKPSNSLFFHLSRKFDGFGLVKVPLFLFALGICSYIFTSYSPPFGSISCQLSTYSSGVYINSSCNIFLFHSCFEKCFNLIPLYQTELGVVF